MEEFKHPIHLNTNDTLGDPKRRHYPSSLRSGWFCCLAGALLLWAGVAQASLVNQWRGNDYTGGNWIDNVGGVAATANGSPLAVPGAFGTNAGVTMNGGYFTVPAGAGPAGSSNFTVAIVFKPTAQMPDYNNNNGWSANYWASIPLIGYDIGGGGMADWGISYGGDTGYKAITGVGVQKITTGAGDIQQQGANLALNAGHVCVLQVDATAGTIATYVDGAAITTNTVVTVTNRSVTSTAFIGGGTFVGSVRFPGQISVIELYNDATNDPVALSQSLLSNFGAPAPIVLSSTMGADVGQSVKLKASIPASASATNAFSVTLTSDNPSVVASTSVTFAQGTTDKTVSLPILGAGTANLTASGTGVGSAAIVLYGLDESGFGFQWLADSFVSGGAWVDSISGVSATPMTGTELAVPGAFGASRPGVAGNGGGFYIPGGQTIPSGASNYTLVVVFKPTAAGPKNTWFWNSAGLIGYDIGGNGQGDFGISWGGDGSPAAGQRVLIGLGLSNGSDNWLRTPVGSPLSLFATHAAALQVNGPAGTVTLSVDGAQVGQLVSQPIRGIVANNIPVLKVFNTFQGQMAEIRIYTNCAVNGAGLTGMLLGTYGTLPPVVLTALTPRFVDVGGTVDLNVAVPVSATYSGPFTVTLSSDNGAVVSSTSVVLAKGATSTNLTVSVNAVGMATLTATGSGLTSASLVLGGLAPRTVVNTWAAWDTNTFNSGAAPNPGDAIYSWAGQTNAGSLVQWNTVATPPVFHPQASLTGRPAVEFNGNNTMVIDSSGDPSISPVAGRTNFSCVVVFQALSAGRGSSGSAWWQQVGVVNNETVGFVPDWGCTLDSLGQFSFGVGGPDVTISQSGYKVVDGLFHVAAMACDSLNGQMRLTVDDQPTTSAGGVSSDPRSNYNIRFSDPGFNGLIAEVRFYEGALTAAEATNLISQLETAYNYGYPDQVVCVLQAAYPAEIVGGDVACTVSIPAGANATGSVSVTVTSSVPAAVSLNGGSSLVLTFPASATNVQSFLAHMAAVGTSTLTASSPQLVPTSVTLQALPTPVVVERFRAASLPSQLPGLATGAPVGSWSGDINPAATAYQGSVAPLFRSAATPAGTPAVVFEATNSSSMLLSGAYSPVGGRSNFTVVLVFKATASGSGSGQWFGQAGILDAEEVGTWNDWGIALNSSSQLSLGTGNPDMTMASAVSVNDGNYHVAVLVADPLHQQLRITVDDQPATAATNSISLFPRNPSSLNPSGGDIYFGCGAHSAYFSGELAEAAFYDGPLPASGVATIISAQRAQYGILVPNDLVLQISRGPANAIQLQWSALATSTGYVLEASTNLLSGWTPAGLSQTTTGGRTSSADTLGAGPKFYRLHKP
jgi:hypothetical protein